MRNLDSAILSFVEYLQFEKRYSQHTVKSYHTDLIQFQVFLQDVFGDLDAAAVSSSEIRSWLASLKESKMSSKSINRKLSTLKSFFKYQLRTGVLDHTPMAQIISPKIGKRLPEFVQEQDMDRLFRHMEFPDTWQGRTDHLLISIFYNTGMRLSELINLKEDQVRADTNMVKVLGKGNKERMIPIAPALAGSIRVYVEGKKKAGLAGPEAYLLVSSKGKKLYPKYAYLTVQKYLSAVTTIERKGPHILRHTFATHLTNNGADLNAIKELLGHASLASTQVYTHNSIEQLKNVHKKAHPKG